MSQTSNSETSIKYINTQEWLFEQEYVKCKWAAGLSWRQMYSNKDASCAHAREKNDIISSLIRSSSALRMKQTLQHTAFKEHMQS